MDPCRKKAEDCVNDEITHDELLGEDVGKHISELSERKQLDILNVCDASALKVVRRLTGAVGRISAIRDLELKKRSEDSKDSTTK